MHSPFAMHFPLFRQGFLHFLLMQSTPANPSLHTHSPFCSSHVPWASPPHALPFAATPHPVVWHASPPQPPVHTHTPALQVPRPAQVNPLYLGQLFDSQFVPRKPGLHLQANDLSSPDPSTLQSPLPLQTVLSPWLYPHAMVAHAGPSKHDLKSSPHLQSHMPVSWLHEPRDSPPHTMLFLSVGHAWFWHWDPVYPVSHSHESSRLVFGSFLQVPRPLHTFPSRPVQVLTEQLAPRYPAEHTHVPLVHLPCSHSGEHETFSAHDGPVQSFRQSHFAFSSLHVPCAEQIFPLEPTAHTRLWQSCPV